MGFLLEEPVSSAPCLRAAGRWERGWRSLGEGGSWPEPLLRAPKLASGLSTLGCADLLGWEQEPKSPPGCGNALPAHRDPEHGSPRRCASRKCHHHSPPSAASSSSSRRRLLHLPSSFYVRASQTSPFQPFLQNPEPTKILFPPVFWSPVQVRGGRDADPSTCPMSCCSFYRNWGIFGGVPARENSVVLKGGEGRRARYLLLLAWLPLPLIGADATGDGKRRAGGNIARRNSGSAALKAKARSKNAPKRCPECRSLLLSLRGRLGRAARPAQGKNLSFF